MKIGKGFTLILKAAVQPQLMLRKVSGFKQFLSIFIPMATMALFFAQAERDKHTIGLSDLKTALIHEVIGILSAIAFLFLAAFLIGILARLTKTRISYLDLVYTTGFAFEIPLVINLIGLACNVILEKGTTLTFGITGILLMILPLYYLILSINLCGTKYRKYFALATSTLICAIGLTGWTFLIRQ